MSQYRIFDDGGLSTLTNHMKVTRSATDTNIQDIENLGADLAGLAEAVELELQNKQDKLTFDTTPTEDSTNPVTSDGVFRYVNENAGTPIVAATSADGVAYTATVPGMDSLVVGKEIVIIPDCTSTAANPTLNINGLGAKYLRCPIGTNNATTTTGANANWIYTGKPVSVRWNGSFWVTDIVRADAANLYGTVPVAKGGTGATDAATALTNLGAAAASHTQAASTVTAGTFAGQVVANASGQTYSTYLLRNTRLSPSDINPTTNGEICWTYE